MTASIFSRRRAVQALALAAVSPAALAQSASSPTASSSRAGATPKAAPVAPWPTRPVKLVVGFPAGSVIDVAARTITEPLAKALGQPVIVENKLGASGTIAADLVAKSTDGHTFGMMNNTSLTVAKMLNPALPYNPERDLAPVALLATTPLMLVVNGQATGTSGSDYLLWLRSLGSKANLGNPGIGSVAHLGMELVMSRGTFVGTHVPYPGYPLIAQAMLRGDVHAALLPPGVAMPHVRAGRLKMVGVASDGRTPLAGDQPALREVGVMGADVELWTALASAASVPADVRSKLASTVIDIVKTDTVRQALFNAGWAATPSHSEGLRQRIRKDTSVFGGIVMLRGIKAEA